MTDTEIKKEFNEVHHRIEKEISGVNSKFEKEIAKVNSDIDDLKKAVKETNDKIDAKFEELHSEMTHNFFLFEQEYGTKINAMYDAILLDRDKNIEKSEKIRVLDKRLDKAELDILAQDRRISILEMKK